MTTPPLPPRCFALVPCAGVGARAQSAGPKQYAPIGGRAMVAHTLAALQQVPRLRAVLVVLAPDDDRFESAVPGFAGDDGGVAGWVVRSGGATRAQTVANGLRELAARGARADDWVLVHDAARCLVRPAWVDRLIDACSGDAVGGLLALPVADTLKQAHDGRVQATVERQGKWAAQTPQMFRLGALQAALAGGADGAIDGITDEASAMEAQGHAPRLVEGDPANLKVTWPGDFALAEQLLQACAGQGAAGPAVVQPVAASNAALPRSPNPMTTMRIGEGWDTHQLVAGRPLILGGVTIPHSHGLLGHSDADALLHAITDALLGAAALGDIGRHFPDTDAAFKGADSIVLLAEAARRVRAAGYVPCNIDATIVAQAPKMAPHIPAMRARIADALGLAPEQVNVKAKTAEQMGPVGEGRAIEARAVCLLAAQH